MVYQDGYYYQEKLFYSSRWTKEMEVTFVHALIDQKIQGSFREYGVNCHAILYAMYDVDKMHGRKLPYTFGRNKLKKLKERYTVFSWIINLPGVFCTHEGRYVVAEDHVWERICKARVLGKCYVNAYEDMFNCMCILFGHTDPNDIGLFGEEDIYSAAPFALVPGWVDDAPAGELDNVILANMHHQQYSSDDSTSLWRFIEEYYPSDDDRCNSLSPLPGIPQPAPFPNMGVPPSQNDSHVSVEHPSSTASNDFPNYDY